MNGQKICIDKWDVAEPTADGDPVLMRSNGLWDDYGGYTSNSFIEVLIKLI